MADEQRYDDDDTALAVTATSGDARPGEPAERLAPGDKLGRYTILEILGEGGMGVVYGAYDPDLDRRVALKLLRAGGDGSAADAARARLLREARSMAKLSHPNVITVYEVGSVGNRDFVAMEFVDGSSLAEWLREEARERRRVLDVFMQAGRGLAAAHEAGMVHRDFKPANVLIRNDGRVLVTDFGLARAADPSGIVPGAGSVPDTDGIDDDTVAHAKTATEYGALTRTGALVGTPAYMAPELHEGGGASAKSDQFAFCVALYEAVYGERPFPGTSVAELRVAITAGAVNPEPKGSQVPAALRKALLCGLSVAPEERYPSIEALLREIEPRRSALREPWLAAGLAAGAALAAIAFAVTLGGGDTSAAAGACEAPERRFEGVWDEDTASTVRASFVAAAGEEQGARAYARFADALDRYKNDWLTMHARVCEAGTEDEGHHMRTGCLLDQLTQVRSIVDVYREPDATMIEQASAALGGLPSVARCDEAVATMLAPPSDPARREAYDEARARLAEAETLYRALQLDRALASAESALSRARDSEYDPVVAEALYWIGEINLHRNKPAAAREALDEALLVAFESGTEAVEAKALVTSALLEADYSSNDEEAEKLLRRAVAAVKKHGDPEVEARLEALLGSQALEDKSDRDRARQKALEHYTRALSIYTTEAEQPLRAFEVMARIAQIHNGQDELEPALAMTERALGFVEDELGDAHPLNAVAHEVRAQILDSAGDIEEAHRAYERARSYWQTARGRQMIEEIGVAEYEVHATRSVRGRVVGVDGKPVAGAEVAFGEAVVGDSRYHLGTHGHFYERAFGVQRAVTAADGTFHFPEARARRAALSAETARGRAHPIEVPAEGDVDGVELELRRYGRIEGTAAITGVEPRKLAVGVVSAEHPTLLAGVEVSVGDDGRFVVDRVPAGRYTLQLGTGRDVLGTAPVTVEAGGTARAAIAATASEIDVDIEVRGERNAPIDAAQVFILPGKVRAADTQAIMDAYAEAVGRGRAWMELELGSKGDHVELDFERLEPGAYSACVIPLAGDMKDPQVSARITRNRMGLDVHCRDLTVTSEKEQRYVLEVPPMSPLPPDVDRE